MYVYAKVRAVYCVSPLILSLLLVVFNGLEEAGVQRDTVYITAYVDTMTSSYALVKDGIGINLCTAISQDYNDATIIIIKEMITIDDWIKEMTTIKAMIIKEMTIITIKEMTTITIREMTIKETTITRVMTETTTITIREMMTTTRRMTITIITMETTMRTTTTMQIPVWQMAFTAFPVTWNCLTTIPVGSPVDGRPVGIYKCMP